MNLESTAIVTCIFLNLLSLAVACIGWRHNRHSHRRQSLFETIVRRGLESGHKVSDDACVELLLTGKLDEEATDFFRWAASECFARYAHDGSISRLYEVWFTPAFDAYRLYSEKTPVCLNSNLTNRHIRRTDVHDLRGKAPGEVPSAVAKKDPPGGNPDKRPMPSKVNQQVGDAKRSSENGKTE